MRLRLVLLASYFILTPFFVFLLIYYQISLKEDNQTNTAVLGAVSVLQAVEAVEQEKSPIIPVADAQAIQTETPIELPPTQEEIKTNVLQSFLEKYDSPLAEYSKDIVQAADAYDLDYRLLPAIAMQESTLCQKSPKDSFNCWGFGIYGGKITKFDDYRHAIETISRTLSREYHTKGLIHPEEIMTKYTPSNTGEWAANVSYVMERIEAAR